MATRVQGEPVDCVVAALEVFLADEFPDPLPRLAKHKWPANWSLADRRPLVLVADDSGPMLWPVKSDHTIRITVGADDIEVARLIARKCLGHILDNLPEGLAHIRRNGTALIETQHSQTGADVASGTVNVAIRTEIV